MIFPGFVGSSYELDNLRADVQRTVNLYPEVIESGNGNSGAQSQLRSTPGLEELFEIGSGPIRGVFNVRLPQNDYLTDPALIIVSGNEIFYSSYDSSGGTWTHQNLSEYEDTGSELAGSNELLATSSGPVQFEQIEFDGYIVRGVLVDGSESPYEVRIAYNSGSSELEYIFYALSTGAGFYVENADSITWIDGYVIFSNSTGEFFTSDLGNLTVDPLSFANSEGSPDNIVGIAANHRNLYVINESTTEVYVNTGNANFPFERVGGGFIEIGGLSRESIKSIGGMTFFLGRTKEGAGQIFMASGLNFKRISTHAIEQKIASYAAPENSRAWVYESEGHLFYCLNFDEMTWVYDLSTGAWHERSYLNGPTRERHRADCHTYMPSLKYHVVGDYENEKVYLLKNDVYSDNGDPIQRLRITPHLSLENKRVFFDSLELDMQVGVGLSSGQGSDPQVVMQFSNDWGNTWSDESWTSAGGQVGGIGEYSTRVIWRRLGRARNRVFKIAITDPVPVNIVGAFLELRRGN